MTFGIGDKVFHQSLGWGVIKWEVSCLNDWYTVKFESGIERNIKGSRLLHPWEV
jgi:hypothetical protein